MDGTVFTFPDLPKINVDAAVDALLQRREMLMEYLSNINQAKEQLKEVEKRLAYFNDLSDNPVHVPPAIDLRAYGNNHNGKLPRRRHVEATPRQGITLTKRLGVLWTKNKKTGRLMCAMPGCKYTSSVNSGGMHSHYTNNHLAQYEANSIEV